MKYLDYIALQALMLLACASIAAAQTTVSLPANSTYTITENVLSPTLPTTCTQSPRTTYKWYKNGVLTGITTPTYQLLAGTTTQGTSYRFIRSTLCDGCPPIFRSEPVTINITAPISLEVESCGDTIIAIGRYRDRSVPDGSYYVELVAEVHDMADGATVPWSVATGYVDGFRFFGSDASAGNAPLHNGRNTLRLWAEGSIKIGLTTFSIDLAQSNIYTTDACSFTACVPLPVLRIANIVGAIDQNDTAYCSTCPNAAIPKMVAGRSVNRYFDSIRYAVVDSISIYTVRIANSSGGNNHDISGCAGADMIIFSYDAYITTNGHGSVIDQLIAYVSAGIPTVVNVDNDRVGNANQLQKWLEDNFGATDIAYTKNTNGTRDNTADKIITGAPIVSGPVVNAVGLNIYCSSATNGYFSSVPSSWWQVSQMSGYSGLSRIIMNKDLTHPLIVTGDGGLFSGGYGAPYNTTNNTHPVAVDAYGRPVARTSASDRYASGAYNSYLLANIVVWSAQQAVVRRRDDL